MSETSNVIVMHYELKDSNTGEILESNNDSSPISFITGKAQIIEKLESEVCKLNEGDKADIYLKAVDACGEYKDEAVQILPREQFAGIELEVGMHLFGQGEDGQNVQVRVKSFDDENVTIDFNHPYAGRDLMFSVSLVQKREATEDELASGMVAGSGSCGCGTSHKHEGSGECCGGSGNGCCGH